MEPEIRYLRTTDGVTLAYYAMGEGVPFVVTDLPYSHLTAERATDDSYDEIAALARLVRYDPRGFGLSQRGVDDFSLDAMVRDLEQVVDKLELRRFILFAARGTTSPIALRYAAAHPERLLRLILYGGVARVAGIFQQIGALLQTPGADWRFVSENISRIAQGWDDAQASQEMAALLREAVTFEDFRRFHAAAEAWDASAVVEHVTTPTLVIALKDHAMFAPEYSANVAAGIKDCRMYVNEGRSSAERTVLNSMAIREFLGAPPRGGTDPGTPAGTAVILFVDIADSTALTERIGDAAFRERARALDVALRAAVRDNGGSVIDAKTLGDGILATFAAASHAVAAALACAAAGEGQGMPVHVGLHAGDVIREDENVFGGAVNIAARISALSAAGEVLVSRTVADLARTSAGVVFEDRGEHELKGVGEAVRVYAVRGREGS